MPRLVVVVVLHDSAPFLEACMCSLERALLGRPDAVVLAVDNGSQDGGPELIERTFGWAEVVRAGENLGFAGGSNLGIARARDLGAEFVYLLNPDTVVEPDFLDRALAVAEDDPEAAAVQSLLLLEPERDLVDSVGNAIHFLGFGYCLGYRRPLAELEPLGADEIPFASGAAVLLRMSALQAVGCFDDRLFLYCEDLDLGWRLRLAGLRARLAPESVVYHRHEFGRSPGKMYLLERNRWLVLLKNTSTRTLLALAPLLLFNELAQLVIAARNGWLREKLRSWRELLRPATWTWLRARRREVSRLRRVSDREIAGHFTSEMVFEGITGPFIRRVANPVMGAAWACWRHLL